MSSAQGQGQPDGGGQACPSCGLAFAAEESLLTRAQHVNACLEDSALAPTLRRHYLCPLCSKCLSLSAADAQASGARQVPGALVSARLKHFRACAKQRGIANPRQLQQRRTQPAPDAGDENLADLVEAISALEKDCDYEQTPPTKNVNSVLMQRRL